MLERCDVLIIGGGVIGCAVFRACCKAGYSCILVEKNSHVLTGASSGNSGILHTGFDADFGTLELECMRDGWAELMENYKSWGLPLIERNAHLVAWNAEDAAKLPGIVRHAHGNGVREVQAISLTEVRRREPQLDSSVTGAVHVPGECVVDPWLTPFIYMVQGLEYGGRVLTSCEIAGAERVSAANPGIQGRRAVRWRMSTRGRGTIECGAVINCAGNFGDVVENFRARPNFHMKPRKGQFVLYNREAGALLSSMILPIPTPKTKGVILATTLYGDLLVGPTAEEQQERSEATVHQPTLDRLVESAEQMIPALRKLRHTIIGAYAGIRPATQHKEYQVDLDSVVSDSWITIAGIRSTGLTASLGIANRVVKALQSAAFVGTQRPTRIWDLGKQTLVGLVTDAVKSGQTELRLPHHRTVSLSVTHPVSRAGLSLALNLKPLPGLSDWKTAAGISRFASFTGNSIYSYSYRKSKL